MPIELFSPDDHMYEEDPGDDRAASPPDGLADGDSESEGENGERRQQQRRAASGPDTSPIIPPGTRRIYARRPGDCDGCHKPFQSGAAILWDPVRKTTIGCPSCAQSAMAAKGMDVLSGSAARRPRRGAASAGTTEIRVQILRVRWQDPTSGRAVTICRWAGAPDPNSPYENADDEFSAVGMMGWRDALGDGAGLRMPRAHDRFSLTGSWVDDPNYGSQFQVARAAPLMDLSPEGVLAFLMSCAGIGKLRAQELLARYGTAAALVRELESGSLRHAEVPFINRKLLASVQDEWNLRVGAAATLTFADEIGVPAALVPAAVSRWGSELKDILTANPYALTTLSGCEFWMADKVAKNLNIAPDDPRRLRAVAAHALDLMTEDGHSYLPVRELTGDGPSHLAQQVRYDARVTPGALLRGLADLHDHGGPDGQPAVVVTEHERSARAHAWSIVRAEHRIHARLTALCQTTTALLSIPADLWGNESPDPAQAAAVVAAAASSVTIITGGPGVGKTFTLSKVVSLCKSNGLTFALCAPTGRAAQRMQEETGEPAATIHRYLCYASPDPSTSERSPAHKPDDSRPRFTKNAENPVGEDVVIVDEMSMVDLYLFDALLDALPLGARLVLVGDVDQLPSIGPGRVLHDVIESGKFPVSRLAKIFRQPESSFIPYLARDINQGLRPTVPKDAVDVAFLHVPSMGVGAYNAEADWITKMVAKVVTEGRFAPQNVQVLAPQHGGPCGVEAINLRIQAALTGPFATKNSDLYISGRYHARVGDRVMHIRNNYGVDVMNGEVGYVLQASPKGVEDFAALQGVWVSWNGHPTLMDDLGPEGARKLKIRAVVEFAAGRKVGYTVSDVHELALAYAATIHKGQGSQFPIVLTVIHESHRTMLSRPLLYTAVTRASEFLLLVGTQSALEAAARTCVSNERKTSLGALLKGAPALAEAPFDRPSDALLAQGRIVLARLMPRNQPSGRLTAPPPRARS